MYGPDLRPLRRPWAIIAAGSIRTPVVGLPISDEEAVPNGRRSRFDGGDIYWKSSTGAWEMHGAIRARWDALGGPNSFLGYPKTDEVGVMNSATEIGRSNTFEHATIFWSGATGAFECHGGILEKYLASGELQPGRRARLPDDERD